MKRFYWIAIWILGLLMGCTNSSLQVYDLCCENLETPTAIDTPSPHFSWKIATDKEHIHQTHYEIRVASQKDKLYHQADYWNSGKIASNQSVMIPYKGKKLESRTLLYWQVRVWDNQGNVSNWSEVQRLGIGILSTHEWQSEYIGLKDVGYPHLRRSFDVSDSTLIRFLHVASLGYHEVYLNGQKVTENILSPAVSQLDKRVNSVTYDVAPYICKGKNDLILWLGKGWYREHTFKAIHQGPLVKAELDVYTKGKRITELITDASWKGRPSEYSDASNGWWYPAQFGGECVDNHLALPNLKTATLDTQTWQDVLVTDIPNIKISPQMCEPNRIIETIQPKEIRQVADSVWIVNLGKAINGWVEINFPALPDSLRITIEYSDWHDGKGSFRAQEEYSTGKHSPHYEDVYLASDMSRGVFRNKFNHHGFQYIRLSHLPIAPEKVTGYLVSTNFKDATTFDSSDADINAIYSMIKYTFRPLAFSGYIVDCPQIERMGYGGTVMLLVVVSKHSMTALLFIRIGCRCGQIVFGKTVECPIVFPILIRPVEVLIGVDLSLPLHGKPI